MEELSNLQIFFALLIWAIGSGIGSVVVARYIYIPWVKELKDNEEEEYKIPYEESIPFKEIYNNDVDTIDISSWSIKDEKDDHMFTISENTLIAPDSYLIFCSELILFTTLFPDIENYYGNLGFNLSGKSDALRIFDNFEHFWQFQLFLMLICSITVL